MVQIRIRKSSKIAAQPNGEKRAYAENTKLDNK
jgi:hypothetical protein